MSREHRTGRAKGYMEWSPNPVALLAHRGALEEMLDTSGPRIPRDCRDCGAEFTIPADRVANRGKWYRLCGSCLAAQT